MITVMARHRRESDGTMQEKRPARQHRVASGVLAILGAAWFASCAEHNATGVPPSQSTVRTTSDVGAPPASGAVALAASGLASDPPKPPEPAWAEAVRFERWTEAATLIDALPEADRGRPEMRYVRARIAFVQGESAKAVALLAGLEQVLPALASDVARWRAEAEVDAGPYGDAATYFSRSARAHDLVRAAEAFDKVGDGAGARKLADKAVATAEKSKHLRDEAAARAVRARLNKTAGKSLAALTDLRWLATKVAATSEGRAAAATLEQLKAPMGAKDRIAAIAEMIERGAAAEALVEIERITGKPGFPQNEILHNRAMALYKARSWPEAAKAFQDAAAAKSGREAEQLFYAARALSRADKDDDAIKLFQDVATRYKKSFFAEKATYLQARLLLQNGRYKDAAAAYVKYLASFPKGEDRSDAEYERTLALLSSENPKTARKSFSNMAHDAKGDDTPKLRELEGVAAMRAGDREDAITIWTDVIRRQPLSWAAQVSRARLAAAGAPAPPLIEPAVARTASPLDIHLPAVPALLVSIGLDGDAEAALASNEQDAAARYAGRESEALCGMYGMMSRAKRRYKVGTAAVGFSMLIRAPSAADRWAWDCVYPRPYASTIKALEEERGLPRGLLYSLMRQESAYDPVVVSPASAVGLMQLMPSTAKQVAAELSIDYDPTKLTSPDLNLKLGAFYIAKLLKTFQGNVALAAAAYNAGPKAVSHWLEIGSDHDADLWVARIPYDETRNYVAKVLGNLARYQWLEGGDAAVQPISLELPTGARAEADAY